MVPEVRQHAGSGSIVAAHFKHTQVNHCGSTKSSTHGQIQLHFKARFNSNTFKQGKNDAKDHKKHLGSGKLMEGE